MKSKLMHWCVLIALSLYTVACAGPKTVIVKPSTKLEIGQKNGIEPKQASPKMLSQTWSEEKPVSISSDSMAHYEEKNETVFKGHVQVQQEDLLLKTPWLKLNTETGRAMAMQGIHMIDSAQKTQVKAETLVYERNLSNITAKDNVIFTSQDEQGQPLQLQCSRLDWSAEKGTAQALGDVTVYYKETSATAEEMLFFDKPKKVILKTNPELPDKRPVVIQGDDRITGDQITLIMDKKNYIISGNAEANIHADQSDRKGKE